MLYYHYIEVTKRLTVYSSIFFSLFARLQGLCNNRRDFFEACKKVGYDSH